MRNDRAGRGSENTGFPEVGDEPQSWLAVLWAVARLPRLKEKGAGLHASP